MTQKVVACILRVPASAKPATGDAVCEHVGEEEKN
eukprot:CAMPEP_0179407588 /NCGR_PEP_ID=MMETSP0799-20121207/1591_1 /TAXON_ID=46947 /ORGANISM="Geminigera cryophila, Strain CCMP2564" /LENGTH=34 /DNA_ID= /DNA_START= /DNA_END= /DNA_ORIENTATION=